MATDFRERLYDSYVSDFKGEGDAARAAPDLRRHIVSRLPADRGARVLDLGCGPGHLVALLGSEGYSNVVGIDTSAEQVEAALSNGAGDVRRADALEFLASGERFDAIIAVDVLEHFDQAGVLRLLDAIGGALRPGGMLVFRSPNAGSPFFGRYRYGDLTHGIAFTASSANQVLAAAGFTDVRVYPTDPAPHGPVSLARHVLWKGVALLLRAYLAIETGEPRGHVLTQNLVAVGRRPGA